MPSVRRVDVDELKDRLAQCLGEVRDGVRLLVTDANQAVIAEIRPPAAPDKPGKDAGPVLGEWLAAGVVIAPSLRKVPLSASPVALPPGTALELIDDLRNESR